MTDTYQAIYDAVRSRIGSADVGQAIRDACHLDGSFAIHQVQQEFMQAAQAMQDPSAIYRPTLAIDGDKWSAVYGSNLQEGVAGFGDSPFEAMADFNRNWYAKLHPAPSGQGVR